MTNEEAKVFLDNLKICIDEHSVVADWLVEIANRKTSPQPRCPKCGARGYIRSLESMGVKLKVFDEYKWKCTNCNKYFKEEPKDEPQLTAKCLNCANSGSYKCTKCDGEMYFKTEPQMWTCPKCGETHHIDFERCPCCGYEPKTEPQTERSE